MAFAVSVEEVWGKCCLGLGYHLAVCPRDGCHSPVLTQPPGRQGRAGPPPEELLMSSPTSLQPPGVVSEANSTAQATPPKGISRAARES